jgi:hypothetical protein
MAGSPVAIHRVGSSASRIFPVAPRTAPIVARPGTRRVATVSGAAKKVLTLPLRDAGDTIPASGPIRPMRTTHRQGASSDCTKGRCNRTSNPLRWFLHKNCRILCSAVSSA